MRRPLRLLVVTLAAVIATVPAQAEDIEVSQYAVSPGSMPYAVAMARGYFKEFSADVTGVRTSPGSGPTIRNLLAGDLSYAEAGVTGILAAMRSGADLRIVSSNVNTVAEVFWAVMPNSPIQSLADMKGKRLGFTTPQSVTQALAIMLVDEAKLSRDDVRMIAAGGFPQALTALEANGLDVAPIIEPNLTINGGRYRILASAGQMFPAMANVLGITTARKIKEKPEFLKGVIAARRKAVEFIAANPSAAATDIAVVYKLDREVIEKVIRNLLASKGGGGDFWGLGEIRYDAMDNMVKVQRLIGTIQGEVDWSGVVDDSMLPDDLRKRR